MGRCVDGTLCQFVFSIPNKRRGYRPRLVAPVLLDCMRAVSCTIRAAVLVRVSECLCIFPFFLSAPPVLLCKILLLRLVSCMMSCTVPTVFVRVSGWRFTMPPCCFYKSSLNMTCTCLLWRNTCVSFLSCRDAYLFVLPSHLRQRQISMCASVHTTFFFSIYLFFLFHPIIPRNTVLNTDQAHHLTTESLSWAPDKTK